MFNKFLEMKPKAARIHTQFATLDILENNPKGALAHAHLEQEGIWRDFATGMALEASGDNPAADTALQAFIDKYAKIASLQVAILYAQRHEPDQMFQWLETAYANRDAGLSRIFVIPFLMDYRDDPRFAVFCRKLGIENLPPTRSAIPEKSIAVLPFENLSRDPENAFLSAGIEDEILTRLAKIAGLKVISRTSTRQYESKPDNLGEIAQQLDVAAVLEGSVQKAGPKVRVNVQLIKAATGAHLWAESYDRDLIDVLGVESDVATQIASALSAALTTEEKARLATRPTNNAQAYELYLRATQLHSGENNSRSAFEEAQKMFEQTVALDPGFAAAHAGLAFMSALLYTAFEPREDYKAKALSEAKLAIQLDPNSVPGHSALAYCLNRIEGSYEAAAREYEIARQLAPNDSNLIRGQGLMRRQQGHWREGLASLQQAAALDPQNISALGWLAGTYEDLHEWKASDPLRERIVTLSQKMSPEVLAEARFIRAFAWFDGTGDPSLLNKAMAETPAEVDQDGLITLFRYQACMFGHRFDEAERIIAASPRLVFENPWGTPAPKSFLQGCAVMAKGEKARARSLFEASLPFFQREVGDHPEVANRHAALGILLAYLDNKPEALAEAQRASELLPESKDAYYGLDISNMCAIIFARLSDADRALPLIERLLRTPRGVPLQELRFSPDWDPLRNDPRFQKILSRPEPKVIYN